MKFMKRLLCATLACVSVFGSVAMMTACETNKPEVEMTLSFNGKEYTVTYEMNRKLTPSTVTHFLELVDGGYYNGVCIHDYSESKWYTGGYEMKNGSLEYLPYYERLAEKNIELTPTVWYDGESTGTVYGEFSANNFSVEKGSVKNGFGALTMYYTSKGNDDTRVQVKLSSGGDATKNYAYNSATSLFYINMSTSASAVSAYCTFATLKEKSVDELEDLQAAIVDYITANYTSEGGANEFAPETEVAINVDDMIVGQSNTKYSVPEEAIVITSMKVTKW